MPDFTIVAKRFSPAEFRDYLAGLALTAWKPSMVVLHNTAVPTLAQRPNGFSASSMRDLMHYYGHVQGWSGGPHLFVDDLGIWVFNPLDDPGVHSPSWNSRAWGVEMLGDYEREGFETGRGLLVRANAVAAVAAMFSRIAQPPDDAWFKLHREDPKTTHACPGKGVSKATFRSAVMGAMREPSSGMPVKVVAYRQGRGQAPVAAMGGWLSKGVTTLDCSVWNAADLGVKIEGIGARPVRELAGGRYDVTPRLDQGKVYLVERA